MNDYNPSEYPQGVPSPYVPRVHPYPSYARGPDYTRPVFDMPFVPRPFNVMDGLGQPIDEAAWDNALYDAPLWGYEFGANFEKEDQQYYVCLEHLGLELVGGVLLRSGVPALPKDYADVITCTSHYRGQKSGYWYGIGVGAATAVVLGALWRGFGPGKKKR